MEKKKTKKNAAAAVRPNRKLASLMKQRDLRGFELARIIGVDASYISHLLSGRRLPSLPVAKKIARCFGVDIEDLF